MHTNTKMRARASGMDDFHVQFRLHLISLSVQRDRTDDGSHCSYMHTPHTLFRIQQHTFIQWVYNVYSLVVHVQCKTHIHVRSGFYSLVARFCCCRCGMRIQMTCACAMDICCIYTVCFIVTFSICAKTMCR